MRTKARGIATDSTELTHTIRFSHSLSGRVIWEAVRETARKLNYTCKEEELSVESGARKFRFSGTYQHEHFSLVAARKGGHGTYIDPLENYLSLRLIAESNGACIHSSPEQIAESLCSTYTALEKNLYY